MLPMAGYKLIYQQYYLLSLSATLFCLFVSTVHACMYYVRKHFDLWQLAEWRKRREHYFCNWVVNKNGAATSRRSCFALQLGVAYTHARTHALTWPAAKSSSMLFARSFVRSLIVGQSDDKSYFYNNGRISWLLFFSLRAIILIPMGNMGPLWICFLLYEDTAHP